MGNYLETVIEKLINDGIITEEELNQRIQDEKAKSPINDLNNIAMIDALQMQMIDQLGVMVAILVSKVEALEAKVNA